MLQKNNFVTLGSFISFVCLLENNPTQEMIQPKPAKIALNRLEGLQFETWEDFAKLSKRFRSLRQNRSDHLRQKREAKPIQEQFSPRIS
jgi:hypothetical protein